MQFDAKTRLLVIAAHPDDEVLGCGGTLAKARKAGAAVRVVFLGEGISARFPLGKYDSREFEEQTAVRKAGAMRALETLGIKDVRFSERLCCQFDTLPILSIAKEIEEEMESWKPTMLFSHNPSEVNIDHHLTFKAVETACRPTRASVPKEIYLFEIVCSGNWTLESSFKPNVYVDVSEFWDVKMKAWRHYEGENRSFPFPRSDEGLATLAQFRGMAAGLEKAEAFKLVRKICIAAPQ